MFPIDTEADDSASIMRLTADLFERSAKTTASPTKREALLEYAKLYREMAVLAETSEAEADDEAA